MSTEQQDPRILTRYLLGALPDTEAQKVDELAITDDEVASRLAETENDLVDAYVRGELSGEDLDRFEKHYLSSEKRRSKVMFAEALRDRLQEEPAASTERALPVAVLSERRLAPVWAPAAAAAVLLAAAGYLFLANERLRGELSDARSQRASLQARAEGLQNQVGEHHAADAAQAREGLPSGGPTLAMIERLQLVSVVLSPQRRGPGQVATISIPSKADAVALQLQLESDEFPQYEVAVKSAADNRVVWRSGKLQSAMADGRKLVTAAMPAALLSRGHFSVELSGAAPGKPPDLFASYAFRVVVR